MNRNFFERYGLKVASVTLNLNPWIKKNWEKKSQNVKTVVREFHFTIT